MNVSRYHGAQAESSCRLAKSKSHIIYNDVELNSKDAVYLNLYQNYAVLAMKMHYYLREWGLDLSKSHAFVMSRSLQLLHGHMKAHVCANRNDSADHTLLLLIRMHQVRPQTSPHPWRTAGGPAVGSDLVSDVTGVSESSTLNDPTARRLGVHAFHTVLSRKPQAYTGILKTLRFELALPKYRRYKKRFRDVISEGLSTLTLLSF